MTLAILTIADILPPADAFVLATGECADWLTRPCRQTIPDEHVRDEQPDRLRSIGEVDFIQHHDREVARAGQ